jgi:hypothetical protein
MLMGRGLSGAGGGGEYLAPAQAGCCTGKRG